MYIQERIRGIMGNHEDCVPYLCMIADVCSLCAADDETVMVAIRMCLRGDCRKNESTTVDAQKYAPFVVHVLLPMVHAHMLVKGGSRAPFIWLHVLVSAANNRAKGTGTL